MAGAGEEGYSPLVGGFARGRSAGPGGRGTQGYSPPFRRLRRSPQC
jgi:hypothetical protein